ncbi:S16 family serine protease [Mycobacterium tuberculosis]|uniref:S16 family serine protease n=1 Tax=Mycobacterium tuberculosis TaxID=1773 RepID=UPI0035106064
MPGKGNVIRTGSLGDVMKESVEAARSVVIYNLTLIMFGVYLVTRFESSFFISGVLSIIWDRLVSYLEHS